MKLLYISSINYPSRLANRIQTIEMAKQLSRLVKDFTLGGLDIRKVAGISIKNFSGSTKSFVLGLKYALFIKRNMITHVFSREDKLLFFTLLYSKFFKYKIKATFEAHSLPDNSFFFDRVIKKVDHVIVLTKLGKEDLIKRGFQKEKIYVIPDGVDPHLFKKRLTKEESREKLSLEKKEKIVLYTGHLYDWKGVKTLLEAAEKLKHQSHVYIVGGTKKDIEKFKKSNKSNVTIVGYVDHNQIPLWLWAADVLVLPNSSKTKISARYTSPLKLFEYMSSERPIVASNLLSLRDIIDSSNAILFRPDDSKDLARSINRAILEKGKSEKRAQKAYSDVLKYTWQKRAERILNFME